MGDTDTGGGPLSVLFIFFVSWFCSPFWSLLGLTPEEQYERIQIDIEATLYFKGASASQKIQLRSLPETFTELCHTPSTRECIVIAQEDESWVVRFGSPVEEFPAIKARYAYLLHILHQTQRALPHSLDDIQMIELSRE